MYHTSQKITNISNLKIDDLVGSSIDDLVAAPVNHAKARIPQRACMAQIGRDSRTGN
jgi:hypothetical protein